MAFCGLFFSFSLCYSITFCLCGCVRTFVDIFHEMSMCFLTDVHASHFIKCLFIHSIWFILVSSVAQCSLIGVKRFSFLHFSVFHTA